MRIQQIMTAGALTCIILTGFFPREACAGERILDWWICPGEETCDADALRELAADYENENPDIEIRVTILDALTGEEETASVLGTGDAPDLILASPEKIVSEWADAGLMTELQDLWDESAGNEICAEVREACMDRDGKLFMMPLFRTVYSMAVNYDAFKKAGVLQYLDENVHSWKDTGFVDCVLGIREYSLNHPEANPLAAYVYCGKGPGQRQMMSFISNFSNGSLVDEYRTSYTVSSSSNRTTFKTLQALSGKGLEFAPDMDGDEENRAFLRGETLLTFSWSAAKQAAWSENNPDFEIFPMMYPNSKNLPVLTGEIAGFGVPVKDDHEKREDVFDFIRYMTEDAGVYAKAVRSFSGFPTRSLVSGTGIGSLYPGDSTMQLFEGFLAYSGEYIPTMPLFSDLLEMWPGLLEQIGSGKGVKKLTTQADEKLNRKLEETYGIKAVSLE